MIIISYLNLNTCLNFSKFFELKKINFLEDKLISQKYPEYEIKVFYPRQFQALRTLYFSENFENFIFP